LSTFPHLPDEIWARLKTWAKTQAASTAQPSLEESEAYVRRICGELTGRPSVLPPGAVAFYASELRDMVAKFRAAIDAEGGVA
jgi:hypothetical protein